MTKDFHIQLNFRYFLILGIIGVLLIAVTSLALAGSSPATQDEIITVNINPVPQSDINSEIVAEILPAPVTLKIDTASIQSTREAASLGQLAFREILTNLEIFQEGQIEGIVLNSEQILNIRNNVFKNINIVEQRLIDLKTNLDVSPEQLSTAAINFPVDDILYKNEIEATAIVIEATETAIAATQQAELDATATALALIPTEIHPATSTQKSTLSP